MNSSKIVIDNLEEEVNTTPWLRQRQTELLQIIEAIDAIEASNYWKVLEKKVFEGVVESLYRRLRNEKDDKEIYRLQGQIVWSEKYSDLKKLAFVYKQELERIKKQLDGKK